MVLRLCFIFALLSLGCSNPYERDNPTDYVHLYTVTFKASEATGGTPPAAIAGSYGDAIQLPDEGSLERSGYVFYGWGVIGSSYIITGDTTLNAVWIPSYTVTFDGNGATGGIVPAAITVGSGSAIQLPEQGTLQRTGYSFGGWNVNSPYTVTGNITIYAKWIPIYTVTFDGNGATGGTAPVAMKADSGSSIQFPEQGNLEKIGELFVGWNTNPSGAGTNYNVGTNFPVVSNLTLYAIFGVPCTVSFDANGGDTAPEDIVAGSGASVTLPSIMRSGYNFGGWNTNSSGTGSNYSGGTSYNVTEDVTLYAEWTVIPPGSIIVSSTGNNSIVRLVVKSNGTNYRSFGNGSTAFIGPRQSYTISNVPAGSYSIEATIDWGGNYFAYQTRYVTVNGNTVSVSFAY